MGKREKKIAVIQEYLPRCNSVYPCYVYGRIPSELINNACMTYAGNVRKEDVFGLIDETVFSSGKKGFLFAEDGFYHSDNNSICRYDEGINYRSLPSSYNLAAFNELLTELYQIETAPTGWDIAGGLLDLASSFLDGLNEEQDTSNESNQSAQQLPAESEPLALSDGNEALDIDDAQEYIKEVLLQVNDVLEYDEDELDSFVEEAQSLIELLEESDGEIEQEIDELLADGENPTQLQKASAKCLQGLELYLPDLEEDPDNFETCQRIVRKYLQTIKQVRTRLKQL